MFIKIKRFLGKIRDDWRRMFLYPKPEYAENFGINYDIYWKKRINTEEPTLNTWQEERAKIVTAIMEKGSSVMDIGCGDGAVLLYFKEKNNSKCYAVDVSTPELEKIRGYGVETIEMDIGDVEKLKELPEVDYVTGFEILEHIPCPEQTLYFLSKKVKKGIIFSLPNTGYYGHRFRLLFGRFPLQWIAHPGEHLRFWTVKDMRFWLDSLGYKKYKIIHYRGIPGLNKLMPKLFSQGMIVSIKPSNKS